MKPRDNVFQGGGAATTDPRKPDYTNLFAMKSVDWADPTVAQLSAERGAHPVEVMIDLVLENDDQMFVQPLVNEQPDHVLGMLRHPRTLATFSDSGAHVCQEMGSSLQTHMLSYWVRQKQAFTLEEAVRKLTFDNASAWELNDRGLLRTGYRADIVLFDEARVKPAMPKVETDLPGGARRLVQKAEGIAATIVNGQVTLENGVATGNVPASSCAGQARDWLERADRTAERGQGDKAASVEAGAEDRSRSGAPGLRATVERRQDTGPPRGALARRQGG